jgi:alpha-tubulin suppressor-like RCC1 family protein
MVPVDLSNVVAIAAGYAQSLALTEDGRIVAWGLPNSVITQVPNGLSNVVAIACGWGHNLALKSDRTVAVWGDISMGQLDVPPGLTRKNHTVSRKVRQACLGRGVRAENEPFLQMRRGALPQGRFSVRTTPFFGLF